MGNEQALELQELAQKYRDEPSADHAVKRRKIALVSGKGGVGKSVLAMLIADSLASEGRRALLVDANCYSPSLHVLANQNPTLTMEKLLSHSRQPSAINFPSIAPGVDFLSNRKIDTQHEMPSGANAAFFLEVIAPYTAAYDFIIFDTHTGIDEWNAGIMAGSHDIILVSQTDPASIIDAYTFLKAAYPHVAMQKFRLLLNQTLSHVSGTEAHEKLNLALQHFLDIQIPLSGMIPFDYSLKTAVDNQAPFWQKPHKGAAASTVQQMMNNYLETNKYPMDDTILKSEVTS